MFTTLKKECFSSLGRRFMIPPHVLASTADDLTQTSQEEPNHITERNITVKRIPSKSVGLPPSFISALIVCALIVATLGVGSAIAADKDAKITLVSDHELPNVPGKSLRAVLVEYGPGAGSPSHRHPSSAFIYARVLEGAIRSKLNDAPERTYQAGESWTERPGDHHQVSQNASSTAPAKLLAIFVVDTSDREILIPDK
jgi:quercetin dioxygenase-like cupin family protein